ncbi:MAG: hypothetical protein ABII88_04140 [Candidatus Omnitrophota bacterium]
MKNKFLLCALLLAIVLAPATNAMSEVKSIKGRSTIKTVMRVRSFNFSEIENLMGKRWKEVITLRPDVQILSMGPDNVDLTPDINIPQKGLIEQVSDKDSLHTIMYAFEAGVLESISIAGKINHVERSKVIEQSLAKYGDYDAIEGAVTEKNIGVLKWDKGKRHIKLWLPYSSKNKEQTFALQFLSQKAHEKFQTVENEIKAKKKSITGQVTLDIPQNTKIKALKDEIENIKKAHDNR